MGLRDEIEEDRARIRRIADEIWGGEAGQRLIEKAKATAAERKAEAEKLRRKSSVKVLKIRKMEDL